MNLARVVGTVVSARKDPRLEGKKLLILKVQPLDRNGRDNGRSIVAVDSPDPHARRFTRSR